MNNEITSVDLTLLGAAPAAVIATVKPATAPIAVAAGVVVVATLTKVAGLAKIWGSDPT